MVDVFVASYHYRMNENFRMIERSFFFLEEEDIWKLPNDALTSIGNLILHLCGNITQYGIASLGNTKDARDRDFEFVQQDYTKSELLNQLKTTVTEALNIAQTTSQEDWKKERMVQGFSLTGIGVALHVVEHFSYHTGQIAFYTKFLKNKDLGFYDGFDLNQLSE